MRFWSDISSISLDEGSDATWIQAIPHGEYKHPLYGDIKIDEAKAQAFANNVKARVRDTDLDIDYDHKKLTTEAAGWVKDAEARPDGLWVLVEWTKDAAQKLRNRAYRYFSPEFVDKWTHPKTNVTHENVLLGGALTNRPFLKDILPINLSEVLDDESSHRELDEGDTMDPKIKVALIKRLGLAEDSTDEQVQAALDAEPTPPVDLSKAKVEKNEDGSLKVTADGAEGELVLTPEPVKASENDDDEIKKLAETHPELAKRLNEQAQRLADMEKAQKLSEVTAQVKEFDRLPPVVADPLRNLLMSAPTKLSEDIIGVITKLHEVGLVPTGQQSGGRLLNEGGSGSDKTEDAVAKFLSEVDGAMSENPKLSHIDAVSMIRETQPQLYSDYEAAIEGVEA